MEPRPPKGSRPPASPPPRTSGSSWEQPASRPGAPPPESGYGAAPRYPAQPPAPYPPFEPAPGYGQPGYAPAPGESPYPPPAAPPPRYPAPGYGQPGYGQPPPPADPYAGYGPGYAPAPAGASYPPPYQSDPYAGYGQPGYGQPPTQPPQPPQPPQQPPGRSGGGWIAPLPDEEIASSAQPTYGGGYGTGGFTADPRLGRPLTPPNRQTQIVAALAIGGLALMILAIVIGFIVFGGEDDDGDDTARAGAAATQTAQAIAAPDEPEPTESATEEAAEPTATTEPEEEAPPPTEPPAEPTATQPSSSALYDGEVTDLLPTTADLPAGFVATGEPTRFLRREVAGNLGGDVDANEELLREWRFDQHWRQEFAIPPGQFNPEDTSVLFISINRFRIADGADAALDLFVSAAETAGLTRIDGPTLGDESVTLVLESSEGSSVTIYVRRGNVLMRVFGFSEQGDPTADVVAMTNAVLAKLP